MKMEFNKKNALLAVIAVMLIGGFIGYFAVESNAYNGSSSLEERIEDNLVKIQSQNK